MKPSPSLLKVVRQVPIPRVTYLVQETVLRSAGGNVRLHDNFTCASKDTKVVSLFLNFSLNIQ